MNRNRNVLIAVIGAIIIAAIIIIRLPLSQTAVLYAPFDDVTKYMADIFRVDVTACQTNHESVWGPYFLASDTQYWIETDEYEPETLLQFQAWFYQIGGEYNTFTIENIDAATTRLTVNQTVKFFITLPYWPRSERAIISAIETDLKKRNTPEQRVPGYRRQSAPQPEP